MTSDELKQTHAALDAQEEGRPIQYLNREGEWLDTPLVCSIPHRPKPSPEPIPWSLEEHPGGVVWVKELAFSAEGLITRWRSDGVLISGYGFISYSDLFRLFTQFDGSPCGRVG